MAHCYPQNWKTQVHTEIHNLPEQKVMSKNHQPKILYLVKLFFQNNGEMKSDKQKLRQYFGSRHAL